MILRAAERHRAQALKQVAHYIAILVPLNRRLNTTPTDHLLPVTASSTDHPPNLKAEVENPRGHSPRRADSQRLEPVANLRL